MAFYYGEGNSNYSSSSWTSFLQTESFVQDITDSIKKNSYSINENISDQTRHIIASREAVKDGFCMVEQRLGDITHGIEELGASFEWGMSLLVEQLTVQNKILTGVLEKLDAIHHTLQTPTLTKYRELYRIGQDRLSKGLLDKALDAFLQAESNNDTDFLIQWSIGHLYLYGLNDDCNVVDLSNVRLSACMLNFRLLRMLIIRVRGYILSFPQFILNLNTQLPDPFD